MEELPSRLKEENGGIRIQLHVEMHWEMAMANGKRIMSRDATDELHIHR
jgi:hypothetical protein